ncbi:MAG: VWA domain-containing protein [Campylobacter sp.]|nr:VWA domain-containing protein [Campylobacter sp.]
MVTLMNPNLLFLLILVPFLYIFIRQKNSSKKLIFNEEILSKILVKNQGLSKKVRNLAVLLSLVFIIIATARPIIKGKEIELDSQKIDVIVGLDVSDSMSVEDIYPNRFLFAVNKFNAFLDSAVDKQVALLAFADRAFLISPLTSDLNSLRYLVQNLDPENFTLKGTSIMAFLEAVNSISSSENKVVLIFSDGGDKSDFSKEIEYAKKSNITVFVYLSATEKGALFKAPNGDMVALKANENIEKLAKQTGGVMFKSSISDDMVKLNELMSIKNSSKDLKTTVIIGQIELFYYPLIIAIVLIFIAFFSLPRVKRYKK